MWARLHGVISARLCERCVVAPLDQSYRLNFTSLQCGSAVKHGLERTKMNQLCTCWTHGLWTQRYTFISIVQSSAVQCRSVPFSAIQKQAKKKRKKEKGKKKKKKDKEKKKKSKWKTKQNNFSNGFCGSSLFISSTHKQTRELEVTGNASGNHSLIDGQKDGYHTGCQIQKTNLT